MTALADIKKRLADIATAEVFAALKTKAYAESPASLTSVPTMIFTIGPQTYKPFADSEDIKLEQMVVYAKLMVIEVTQGIPGEAESAVEKLLEPCRDMFLARPGLSLDADHGPLPLIKRSVLENTGGIAPIAFAEQMYLGVIYKLTIERIVQVTYAPGE